MDKLDRLGWADGVCARAFGTQIGIRISNPSLLAPPLERLPPGWEQAASARVERLYSFILGDTESKGRIRRFHLLYRDDVRLIRSNDLPEMFKTFRSDVEHYVAEWARPWVFVHAGVVAWQGSAIVLPGRSFSGKSTLTAALVRAGAVYYSDEYAVFDSRGRVHPYPRPLSLRDDTGHATQLPVEVLAGSPGKDPLPVKLVLLGAYRPGSSWHPRPLSTGQGTLALMAHAVSARRRPRAALVSLSRAASRARILKGTRGDARHMADSILENWDAIAKEV